MGDVVNPSASIICQYLQDESVAWVWEDSIPSADEVQTQCPCVSGPRRGRGTLLPKVAAECRGSESCGSRGSRGSRGNTPQEALASRPATSIPAQQTHTPPPWPFLP